MLKVRDFVPLDQSRFLALRRNYESFENLVSRANAWIEARDIKVINLETVVLPNVRPIRSPRSVTAEADSTGFTNWAQILRIWYEEE